MIIKVTQEDIENGQPSEPCFCPIALAAKRVFPNRVIFVSIEWLTLDPGVPGAQQKYHLPPDACGFIFRFDDYDDPVQPFEFELGDPV